MSAPAGPAALSVESVTRTFTGLTALEDVSFAVPAGEIYGIIGPNGAGKTTLFNCMSGALRPDRGRILLDGRSLAGMRPHEICRLGLARTFQLVKPFRAMSVLDNVKVAAFVHHPRAGAAEQAARRVLDRLGMGGLAAREAAMLGLAGLRRLEIARALATEPRILLLDEMLAGLTAVETDELCGEIRTLNREGLTIVIVEHSIAVLRALCSRAVVLDFGRVLTEGSPAAVLEDERVREAYLGTATG